MTSNISEADVGIKTKCILDKQHWIFFEVCHPRCVSSITKNFCLLQTQSNTTIFHLLVQWVYDYIGCNYMFRPYMLTIFRLQFNYRAVIQDVWGGFRVLGVGERDLVVSE